MRFSRTEISHLLRAWVCISLAFAVFESGLHFDSTFLIILAITAVTAGVGFLAHELMHKFVAQRYGCWAEFRANNRMLLLMLVFSPRVIFAAPGGVLISGHITARTNGIISLAGPVTNLALGCAFAAVTLVLPSALQPLSAYGMDINFWLFFFNMLPFPGIDGSKVWKWNKAAYIILFLLSIVLAFGAKYAI